MNGRNDLVLAPVGYGASHLNLKEVTPVASNITEESQSWFTLPSRRFAAGGLPRSRAISAFVLPVARITRLPTTEVAWNFLLNGRSHGRTSFARG
jgi:hypothetical protein